MIFIKITLGKQDHHHLLHHPHHHHHHHIDMVFNVHLSHSVVNLALKSVCFGKPEKELDQILAGQYMLRSYCFFKCPTLTNQWRKHKKASTFDNANLGSQKVKTKWSSQFNDFHMHHIPSQFIIIIKIIVINKVIRVINIIVLIYFLAMPSTPDVSPYERSVTAPSTAERPSLKGDFNQTYQTKLNMLKKIQNSPKAWPGKKMMKSG